MTIMIDNLDNENNGNKEENKDNKPEVLSVEDAELEKMVQAGLHFGHKTTKKHPKMEPYLFSVRNGVNVIDISKTRKKLDEALSFLSESASQGKTILLVGTKIQLKGLVKEIAEECDIPYVNERWLGGTITNFEVIKKRVDRLKDLEKKKEEGDLEKYTKKERLKIDREIESLKVKFQGIKSLSNIPDVLFVLDMSHDDLALKEAEAKGIKIVAIADTNTDPNIADYPIPANDDALSSVKYILEKVKDTILKSKSVSQKEKSDSEDLV